jgi:ATP-dependent Clp protease ATP-binding subunit ClpA
MTRAALTGSGAARPYQVVLFDEIEGASTFSTLLQVPTMAADDRGLHCRLP